MRKTLHLKSVLRVVALLTFAALIIYGCKKDKNLSTANLTPDQTAVKMQEWLSKQKTDSVTSYAAKNLLNNADWKTAHTLLADSGKVFEIVTLPATAIFNDIAKVQQRYLVITTQNETITANIFELFGNKTDVSGKGDLAIINFNKQTINELNGDITVSTWDNHVRKLKSFENGTSHRYAVLVPKQSNKNQIQSSGKKLNACIDWYWSTYEDGILVEEEYVCSTCDIESGCMPAAYRNPKGTQSIKTNCATAGAGPTDPTPVFTNADSVANFDKHIDSSKLNPCFNHALYVLSQVQSNCMGNTIDFFTKGSAPDYTWNMQMGGAGGNNGQTGSSFDRVNKTVTTTFNSSNFSTGSDLAVARTILHESVHAYLVTYFGIDPLNANVQYSDLVERYNAEKKPNLDKAQHNIMVTDFLSDIALILYQYAQNQNYSVDINYCTDLAWGGLTNTDAFKTLSNTDKSRILKTLNIEQSGQDGFGNPVLFKGQASNCP